MGIEQNKNGVYVPDKSTKWPNMTDPERSKVYESHKEKYAGSLAKTKLKLEEEKKDFWSEISHSGPGYRNEFKASDPKLKGMPVSMALMSSFVNAFNPVYGKRIGMEGKGKDMMLYCLNYLQNAPENKSLKVSSYPNGNIDTVPKDGFVSIAQVLEGNDPRWQLQIFDAQRKTLFAGFIFPDKELE